MSDEQRLVAKLQRKAERRSRHVADLLDRNDILQHEVQRLSDALIRCYFTGNDEVKKIVAAKVPTHLRKVLAKQPKKPAVLFGQAEDER